MSYRKVLLATVIASAAVSASAATVFSTNFDSGVPAAFSGGNLESVSALNGVGNAGNTFTGNLYRAANTITLTLSGLPAHTGLNLGFLFAAIDSWDGPSGFNCCGPDVMTVTVNGNAVFSKSFNLFGHATGDYNPPVNGQLLYGTNVVGTSWGDQAYDMSLEAAFQNIADAASTLTITWTSTALQGYDDESFALDNVKVDLLGTTVGSVPEPGSLALLGLSIGLCGLLRRSRRQSS